MRSACAKGGYSAVLGGGFTEDAPRPPVPGEEGELAFGEGGPTPASSSSSSSSHAAVASAAAAATNAANPLLLLLPYASKGEASAASTPRRPDLDLGYEPEGSASPTPPCVKWAESLHCLLDDQEGIHLFARFLKREGCGDLLDFWFACSGFRKLEAGGGGGASANREKKLKLAKAICRKYVLDGGGIVSRRIEPPTRCRIRERVAELHVDPAMFEQAQTEVQAAMEESAYPLFLKSDLYLEYARAGETGECYGGGGRESPGSAGADRGSVPGNAAVTTSSVAAVAAVAAAAAAGHYLPTLAEDEEWRAERESSSRRNQDGGGGGGGGGEPAAAGIQVTQRLLAETASQRAASGLRFQDSREYRRAAWPEPTLPYYVNGGYAAAPAASANDSEQQSMSSDADSVSLTDSSLDGVPPYRNRKQHRREMHESAKANGRVPLPHIPRTHRIPKDVHVEPGRFAADLISRLEAVQREREAQERLEARLKRVRLGDDDDLSGHAPKAGAHCQPPPLLPLPPPPLSHGHAHYALLLADAHEENPESILDDHVQRVMRTPGGQTPGTGRHSPVPSRSPDGLSSAGRHAPKGDAGVDFYASKGRNYADGMSSVSADPGGHSAKGSAPSCKRAPKKGEDVPLGPPEELERNHKILLWMMEGEKESGRHKRSPYGNAAGNNNNNGGGGGGVSNARPSHPFIQDPTMPPNLAPNPLTQLEEVRRRLEEESLRGGATAAAQQPKQRHKAARRQPSENTTVAYYFCGEPIPYRTSVKGRVVTLGQFKELLTKRGSYRFYFKKLSDEFDCGVVFEEVREDHAILPIFEEKIIGKVEKID